MIAVYVLLSFFGGAAALGLFWFLWTLVSAVRRLDSSFRTGIAVMQSLKTEIKAVGEISEILALAERQLPEFSDTLRKELKGSSIAILEGVEAVRKANTSTVDAFTGFIKQVDLLKSSFDLFNSLVWETKTPVSAGGTPKVNPVARVAEEGTFIPGMSDERAAHNEHVETMRAGGVELDEERMFQPESSQMYSGDKEK